MFLVVRKKELLLPALLLAGVTVLQAALWLGSRGGEIQAAGAAEVELPATVILDAGHGGEDGGAVAADGTEEADLNLAVTKELEAVLTFLGVPVVMTRTEDVSLHDEGLDTVRQKKASDLENRAALVRQVPGGVLLSIHQNTLPSVPSVHGAQVFFNTAEGSEALALALQDALNAAVNREKGKVAKAADSALYLMRNVSCPAVLVECGFLSNSEELARLRDADYQRYIAVTISAGYLRWTAQAEKE